MINYKRLTQEQTEIVQDAIMNGIDTAEFGYIKNVWLGRIYQGQDRWFVIKGYVPDVYRFEHTSKGAMFDYSFNSYGTLWTVHKEVNENE